MFLESFNVLKVDFCCLTNEAMRRQLDCLSLTNHTVLLMMIVCNVLKRAVQASMSTLSSRIATVAENSNKIKLDQARDQSW